MTKIDLKDCTFLIPFFYDHQDRLENIEFLIDYLDHHFETNIFVGECCERPVLETHPIRQKITKYFSWFSDSDLFFRTKVLNDLCKETNTKIIVNQDTDVILPVGAYERAKNKIMEGSSDVVYPYSGEFNECRRTWLPKLKETFDFNIVPKTELNCIHPSSVGGCIFMDREKFIKVGMENENIKFWGFDDNERYVRFRKMGLTVSRLENYLLHIEHWRGKNSTQNHPHYVENIVETEKINRMSKEELDYLIDSWEWVQK